LRTTDVVAEVIYASDEFTMQMRVDLNDGNGGNKAQLSSYY